MDRRVLCGEELSNESFKMNKLDRLSKLLVFLITVITSNQPKSNCQAALTHLHLAIWLQQLSDRHLVLLQSSLHQLGAADVDRALYVRRIVLRKRPAVNHQ